MQNNNKIARYRICQILGEGATSTVYKATDTKTNKTVAIKVFSNRNPNFTQGAVHIKMQNECRILQCLKSEHIVKLEEYMVPNTIILEHCDSNLISFLNEHELDFKGIKKIIRMALLGVYEIHSKGIIHRDLKLGNILLKGDVVKICDFGLSCFQSENDFSYCGTKDYLAPEMAILEKEDNFRSKYDYKIDIFALGIIYKALLSRRKNVDISEIDVESDTKDLIRRMTNQEPENRPNAYEMLSHRSFDELFVEVPDFRLLKTYMKMTKYGKVIRFSRFNSFITQYEEGIGIVFGESINLQSLEIIAKNEQLFSYSILLNGKTVDQRLMSSTVLKYYNYLASYFKVICDKTIQFEISEGNYRYYRTISNISVVECNLFKAIKRGKNYEITYFTSNQNPINSNLQTDNKFVTPLIESIFRKFEEKSSIPTNLISIEYSSYRNTISLTPEHLFKKHQFCTGIGWCIKENFGFTILLNEGTKICIFVEEFCISINNSEKILLEDVNNRILDIIKTFLKKFV